MHVNNPAIIGKILIASSFGLLIGFVAGLLGVGGGEFRLPGLVYLGFSVAVAAAANLVIGMLTVTVGLAKRLTMGVFDVSTLGLIIAMSAGSIFGAYAGADVTGRVSEKRLKYAMGALLLVLGLKMIHGALVHEAPLGQIVGFPFDVVLAIVTGGMIGVACGALGVAGGELRVPTLIYVFNQPIKVAGTASLAVSLPSVAAGAFKHGKMGHISRDVFYISLAMGIPSVVGAYIGAAFVIGATEFFLKIFLGIILLLAMVRMLKP
jgi:uncharacterized membrane protein YfcA